MVSGAQEGNIVYQVEMDVAGLLVGQRQVNARLDEMESKFNSTGKAVGVAEKSFLSLSRVAASLTAALSVQQVAQYANAWVDVSNKLVNAVRPSEQLADVTQRVFDISQNTRSGIEATAALYGRLERATRSAGTSTADLAKLTSTINKGLVVSGASAAEASSTMIQLSQALASGVLRGEEFNSISENGSRLAVALADSLGVTQGELRAMAAQGKLTTDVVVKGLLTQGDAIAKEFGNTIQTMGQAFQVAGNNITKFVGESTSVQSGLKVFNDTVISLSENIDIAAGVITGFAAVLGGRYAGALALATQAKVSDMLAAKAQSAAISASASAAATAATVTARKAMLDKEAALSSLALAQAEYNVAKGTNAEAFALANLNSAKSVAIQRSALFAEAQLVQAGATKTATAAAAAATTTVGGLARNALALIGGPAGFAMIAGAALFYFYQKTQQAKQEAIDFADKLDGVIAKMRTMSNVQLAAEIDKATKSINVQSNELKNNEARLADLTSRLESAKAAVAGLSQGSLFYSDALSKVNQLESEHIQLTAQVESEQAKLSQTVSKAGILRAQANGSFSQGIDLLKRDGHEAGVAAGLFNQLSDALNVAAKAKDNFNSQSLMVGVTAAGQKQLDQLTQENELLQITDKRQRAVKAARLEAINAGEGNQNVINQLGELAGANYDLQQAETARNKGAKAGAKTADEGAQKIADLQRQLQYLNLSYDDNSREAAVYNAVAAAGAKATETQKREIGELAGALFDAKQKQQDLNDAIAADPARNADKTYSDATKQLKRQYDEGIVDQQQYNKESLKLAQDHKNAIAQANANALVSPAQEAQGSVDPVQALANEHAKKLALIQQFETQKGVITANGLALMNAANMVYEKARTDAQWALFTQQSVGMEALGAAVDSFGQGASSALSGIITGTQSASDAMRGLADTVLSSVIQTFVEMGLQQAKSAIMGASVQQSAIAATTATQVGALGTTTAASVTSAGTTMAAWLPAALVASVGSFGAAAIIGGAALVGAFALSKTLSGKRKNGGPVSAGSMYQVGEGGMPEIYQASNGSQYMIPGDNGKVISNKDMQGSGGGINVSVNITNTNGSFVDHQVNSDGNGGLSMEIFIADMDNGGPMSQAVSRNHQAPRRATN
ncbi:Phage-related minor tail protein [Serratia proteamaculans]|uniref:tape measure protein n=1 Tax=Serratia proteamaculans TaxID=28151 RepID=UPI002177F940|nr:tape measure protein [Serratia proteamaculans]CAI0728770.1 Phage-related minor tail protein [Serratia proteamaculans]CAI1523749.1 Phage-related minor tail protein [Serratia proteamaculans]